MREIGFTNLESQLILPKEVDFISLEKDFNYLKAMNTSIANTERAIFDTPISIAMAAYNHAQYIVDAIYSVVFQTHKNWELVIVDDASIDNTQEAIKECIKKYGVEDKVIVIKNESNKGYGYSLDLAIKSCLHNLVVVLDSDDVLYGDQVFQSCIQAHKNNPQASLTYSNYYPCTSTLRIKSKIESRQIELGESYFNPLLVSDDSVKMKLKISHLKTIKKSFYNLTSGIDPLLRKTIDKDLVFKLEEVGDLVFIDEFLMLYRKHAYSMAAKYSRASLTQKQKVKDSRQTIFVNALKRRKGRSMKVVHEGSKRAAVSRMFPYWKSHEISFVNRRDQADVVFSISRMAARSKIPILVRIDGIYYDKATDFLKRNEGMAKTHLLADAIVYQSHCSKALCETHLPLRHTDNYAVVYNGVKQEDWYNPVEHSGINIVSCSKWRRVKRLSEIIEIFQLFRLQYPEAILHIIGPFGKGSKQIKSKNVIYYGEKKEDKVKQIINQADMSLHFCKKDSCPSNVVESIAAGIPVITTNLCGGAAEMCELAPGCEIVYEGIQDYKADYIYEESYNNMTESVKEDVVESMLRIHKDKVRVYLPEQLSISYVADQYLQLLRGLIA